MRSPPQEASLMTEEVEEGESRDSLDSRRAVSAVEMVRSTMSSNFEKNWASFFRAASSCNKEDEDGYDEDNKLEGDKEKDNNDESDLDKESK